MDGASVLLGGAFLLTPGILTDLAGLALLLPPSRRWIQGRVRQALLRGLEAGTIRMVTLGPDGPRAWGVRRDDRGGSLDLDPSKGIVVEGDED
jgi:UPF0716 protein FxsA